MRLFGKMPDGSSEGNARRARCAQLEQSETIAKKDKGQQAR
jgi:hypothetical protein